MFFPISFISDKVLDTSSTASGIDNLVNEPLLNAILSDDGKWPGRFTVREE
jgi:hypothetical protein